eukprot:CAMPEP_0198140030 /NCGR_PEP_ID=MMETSP1443-20131203/3257_1 /TAXON_ID=186043 /ORGANISM="Entomoneis sp., Strain CCMP2396" /LENGTH=274 /DNA_ID=CAMNT_0043802339 /DNA_START=250 /DNA_END=1074 /DNA_ORIENTATION=-
MPHGSDDTFSSSSSKHHHNKSGTVKIDLETMREWWEKATIWTRVSLQNKVRLDTLRPLSQFLGISPAGCLAPEAFGTPVKRLDKSTLEKLKSRISLNLAFFLTNYVLVVLLVATVVALMHPGMILFVGLLYGLWTLHTAWGFQELIVFGVEIHVYLTFALRARILTALTALVVFWKCCWPFVHAIVISILLIASHALLRDPKHIELSVYHNDDDDEGVYDPGQHPGPQLGDYDPSKDDEGGHSSAGESVVMVERPSSKSPTPPTTTSKRRGDVV